MNITKIAFVRLEADLSGHSGTVEKLSLARLSLCVILALSIAGLPAVSALSSDWRATTRCLHRGSLRARLFSRLERYLSLAATVSSTIDSLAARKYMIP